MNKDPYALFLKKFPALTDIQKRAFPIVESGANCIITAPTGSGKTEAALLPVLKKLVAAQDGGIGAIYITPLRALNRDLQKRLVEMCAELDLSMSVRHGDTPQSERKEQARSPPRLLITTPETMQNLYLSPALRAALKNVKTVIVDELHELYFNKRGAQLTVALERLEELAHGFQRVGVSATIGNSDAAAKFLCGDRKCSLISSDARKELRVEIEMPKRSTSRHSDFKEKFALDEEAMARLERVAELIKGSESTLMFANTRQVVESLGSKLIQLDKIDQFGGIGIHHGSLDKNERVEVENAFKERRIKSILATSSLELGIDIGSINLVLQYSSPRQAIRLVQRVGRGGHRVGELSHGIVIVSSVLDALESIAVTDAALDGELERAEIEHMPMDVLVNQIASMVLEHKSVDASKAYETIRRATPFRAMTKEQFAKIAKFMQDERLIRINGKALYLSMRSRGYFITNISVIPDTLRFVVKNVVKNRIISTLDEKFVSSNIDEGSTFITKGLPWKVVSIEKDTVFVEPSIDLEAAIPDWEGEDIPVSRNIAVRVVGLLEKGLKKAEVIDKGTLAQIEEFGARQKKHFVPSNDVVVVEEGDDYAIAHIALGKPANEYIARIIGSIAAGQVGTGVTVRSMPYAVILDYSSAKRKPNLRAIFDAFKAFEINKESSRRGVLTDTDLFRYKFVQVAKLFGVVEKKAVLKKSDVNRLVAFYKDSPIFDETLRDLYKNYLDAKTVSDFIDALRAGKVRTVFKVGVESPLARELIHAAMHHRELLLPTMPTESDLSDFAEKVGGKNVQLLCTFCGAVFTKKTDLNALDDKFVCPICKSPMIAVHSDDKESAVNKKLEGKRLGLKDGAAYADAIREAGLVSAYGQRALIALSTYGVGISTAARLLKMLRVERKQFLIDLIEAQKTFVRTKKYWKA